MKKYLFRTILVSTSLLTLGTAVTPCVPVLADETNSSGMAICSDDEYYVLDEPSFRQKLGHNLKVGVFLKEIVHIRVQKPTIEKPHYQLVQRSSE